jgi:hypothetical protein
MKNIHILPTDKPSKLQKTKHDNFFLSFRVDLFTDCTSQHIYVTSDDKIKEGDFFYVKTPNIHGGNIVTKCLNLGKGCWSEHILTDTIDEKGYHPSHCKKIILTTDQDLIKDGVQAIDDTFLKWFVNNPSCEEVEVEKEDYSQKCRECGETVKRGYICNRGCFMKSGNFIPTDKNIKYKIIIPKEELKPIHQQIIDIVGGEDRFKEIAGLKPKPETIEEAAERMYTDEDIDKQISDFKYDLKESTSTFVKQNCEGAIFGLNRLKQFKKDKL